MTYTSELESSGDRFLSRCLQQVLGESWVSPADFVAAFGPQDIMRSLEGVTELRARILIEAAGVHERIAVKKSTDAAAEDLQIALEEGICDPTRLLELFGADDRVRYLDNKRLWQFVSRDEFWKKPSAKGRERMAFVIATALEEKLIDLGGVIDGVTSERLASDLPKPLLEKVLVRAVGDGRSGSPFDPASLFEVVTLQDWVAYVPLDHLWSSVVVGRVVPAAALEGEADGIEVTDSDIAVDNDEPPPPAGPGSGKARKKSESKGADAASPPVSGAEGASSVRTSATSTPVSGGEGASSVRTSATSTPVSGGEGASSVRTSATSIKRDAAEEEARQKAIESLERLGRLPPRHDGLDTATLLAIDSLYADLTPLTTDEAREECIRDAFPNEAMLRSALLALAEVLDPSIDIVTLEKEADVDSLIKLVLFEERRKLDRSRRSMSPPPASASSPPPPLPPLPGQPPGAPPPVSTQRSSATPPPLPAPPPLPNAAGGGGRGRA